MSAPETGVPYTPEFVAGQLGRAGMTLLAMHITGVRPAGMRGYWPAIPGAICDDGRPAPPSARRISEMDQALGWIVLIPEDQARLRRLVGARALISPRTEKPIFSWRVLGEQLGCHHNTAKTLWLEAIEIIVLALNRPRLCEAGPFATGRGALQEVRRLAQNRTASSGGMRRVLERSE